MLYDGERQMSEKRSFHEKQIQYSRERGGGGSKLIGGSCKKRERKRRGGSEKGGMEEVEMYNLFLHHFIKYIWALEQREIILTLVQWIH